MSTGLVRSGPRLAFTGQCHVPHICQPWVCHACMRVRTMPSPARQPAQPAGGTSAVCGSAGVRGAQRRPPAPLIARLLCAVSASTAPTDQDLEPAQTAPVLSRPAGPAAADNTPGPPGPRCAESVKSVSWAVRRRVSLTRRASRVVRRTSQRTQGTGDTYRLTPETHTTSQYRSATAAAFTAARPGLLSSRGGRG